MKPWAVCVRCAIAYPKTAERCPRHDVETTLYSGPFGEQRWVPFQVDYSQARDVVVRIPARGVSP